METSSRKVARVKCRMFPDLVVLESMEMCKPDEDYSFVHGVTMFMREPVHLELVPEGNSEAQDYFKA